VVKQPDPASFARARGRSNSHNRRGNDMKSTMTVLTRSMLVIAATIVLVGPIPANAHNSHGVRIYIQNAECNSLRIAVWGGKNTTCSGGYHKRYTYPSVNYTTANTIKCHGNGEHRCHVRVRYHNNGKMIELESCREIPENVSLFKINSNDSGECSIYCSGCP